MWKRTHRSDVLRPRQKGFLAKNVRRSNKASKKIKRELRGRYAPRAVGQGDEKSLSPRAWKVRTDRCVCSLPNCERAGGKKIERLDERRKYAPMVWVKPAVVPNVKGMSMEKLVDIGLFESCGQNVENGGQSQFAVFDPVPTAVENLDLVSEANPPSSAENPSPKIPKWGRSLGERVGNLERWGNSVDKRLGNLEQATRAGFEKADARLAKLEQGMTQLGQSVARIEQAITRR